MRSYILGLMSGLSVVFVLAIIFSTGWVDAQRGSSTIVGAGDAGTLDETITWKGLDGRGRKVSLQRLFLKIPESYGVLTTVTGGDTSTLWFVDKKGILRNVFIGNQVVAVEPEARQ